MTHAQEVVAGLLRGTFAPLPEMDEAGRLLRWNAKAARTVAEDRKANPGAVIVGFRKRR
jgi:hypothetical protein